MISAIILAAGESKRMGKTDKRFLTLEGKWLVQHVLEHLLASKVAEIILVRNGVDDEQLIGFQSERVKIVVNENYQKGMTTSIQKGVSVATEQAKGYLICLADQPLLTAEEYNLLLEAFLKPQRVQTTPIIVPFYEGKKGNPVLFSAHYKTAILTHQEMEGCKGIVQANKSNIVEIEMPTSHILLDVDTPADYDRLIFFGA